jgi:hypothetical protein
LLLFVALAALIGYGASVLFAADFWLAFGITAAALLAVGWIATAEDAVSNRFNGRNASEDRKE